MEMSLFLGVEDGVKTSDKKAGDSNDVTLDKAIPETMELRNDFYGQDAAIAGKYPLLKNS